MMKPVSEPLKTKLIRVLRWSERYTKTDMVYLATSGIWNNLTVVTSTVMGLALSIAFANLLPKEVYGTYQYLLSLSAIVATICFSGMQQAVEQSIARGYEGDMKASLRAQLKWNLVPAALGLVGATYYALHANYTVALALIFVAAFTPLISAFNIYGGLLSGTRQFKRIFVYAFLTNIAYYSAITVAILFFKNAVLLVFVNLAVNAAAAVYFYFRTLKVVRPNERTDPQTISYGKHLSVMGAFSNSIAQLDSVLVFHFLGPAELAVYSFATLIPERAAALLSFIGSAAFPKYSQRTLKEVQKSIIPQTIRAAAFGAVLTVIYIVLSPLLYRLLFPKYLDAIPYTQAYAPVILLLTANLVSLALTAQRRKMELYITSFVNPIILICLQVPLLMIYGIWGMIAARLLGDTIAIILGLVLLLQKGKTDLNAPFLN